MSMPLKNCLAESARRKLQDGDGSTRAEQPRSEAPTVPAYRYRRIGTLYVCLDQNVARMAWLLWFRANPFMLEKRRTTRPLHRVYFAMVKALRILRFALVVSASRAGLLRQQPAASVTLPFFGNIATRLRIGGYKLFDLAAGTVITSLAPDHDLEVVSTQITRAEDAARLGFAPAVLEADESRRCYTESYFNAPPLSALRIRTDERLHGYIVPTIAKLLTANPPRRVRLTDYVGEMRGIIFGDSRGIAHPMFGRCLDARRVQVVRWFVEEQCALLSGSPWSEVFLSDSHGDLHAANILLDESGTVVIDWNNFTRKSILYDLHMVLFRLYRPIRPSRPSATPEANAPAVLTEKINVTIRSLQRDLQARCPQLAEGLEPAAAGEDHYRRLFYLEFMCKAIEKFWENTSPEALARRLDHTIRWVENFRDFEDSMALRDRADPIFSHRTF
jgi:hypothetical protein